MISMEPNLLALYLLKMGTVVISGVVTEFLHISPSCW